MNKLKEIRKQIDKELGIQGDEETPKNSNELKKADSAKPKVNQSKH